MSGLPETPGATLEVKRRVTISLDGTDVYTLWTGVKEYLEIVKEREWSEPNWWLVCLFTQLEEELRSEA